MTLAPSALSHLGSACDLFEQVLDNPRAAKVLVSKSFQATSRKLKNSQPILQRLKGRATLSNIPPHSGISKRFRSAEAGVPKEVNESSVLGGVSHLGSSKPSPAISFSPRSRYNRSASSPSLPLLNYDNSLSFAQSLALQHPPEFRGYAVAPDPPSEMM